LLARPGRSRIDELLAAPPLEKELSELARGPQVEVAPGFPAEYADRARAFVTSALRAASAIRFDEPMPVTGVTRMWDYIAAHVRRIEVYAPQEGFVVVSGDARTPGDRQRPGRRAPGPDGGVWS
jgi:hypothetical protein